tara:strand:- start:244445 stop:244927 length:483 start_codon:yes stop_codon:yes gene_type:complete
MEMLVTLAIFAVIAAIATHSLIGLTDRYNRTREDRAARNGTAQIQHFLDRVTRETAQTGPLDPETLRANNAQDQSLNLSERDEHTELVWQSADDSEIVLLLEGQGYVLQMEDLSPNGSTLILSQSVRGGTEIVALSGQRVTAQRNCRYDAIGRRCFEAAQ